MNKYPFLRVNEEIILEAISFNFRNNIEEHLHSIQWEVKAVGESSEKIGNGKSIKYKINEKYSGKRVIFRAYIKQDSITKYPLQNLICDVERQVSLEVNGKKILIKEVTGPKEALVGDTVNLKVTKYNIDSNKVTESQKKQIKWDVKGIREEKKVFTYNKGIPFVGEAITFMIPESWGGQSVLLMPYLRTSTENISVNISVKDKNENQTKATECFCGKEHIDLRNRIQWRTQFDSRWGDEKAQNVACLKTCKLILESAGLSPNSAPNDASVIKVASEIETPKDKLKQTSYLIVDSLAAKRGNAYIDEQLEEGYPVLVGVDHTYQTGYNEGTTDHFIVIVGRGCDKGEVWYLFYEVGTRQYTLGRSDANKLILNPDGSLHGEAPYKTRSGDKRKYVVTQIRKNKKK